MRRLKDIKTGNRVLLGKFITCNMGGGWICEKFMCVGVSKEYVYLWYDGDMKSSIITSIHSYYNDPSCPFHINRDWTPIYQLDSKYLSYRLVDSFRSHSEYDNKGNIIKWLR
jgi:hypothetical protein